MKRLEPGLMRRGWILILAMAAIHATAVVTTGDIRTATADRGRRGVVDAAKFIGIWRNIK